MPELIREPLPPANIPIAPIAEEDLARVRALTAMFSPATVTLVQADTLSLDFTVRLFAETKSVNIYDHPSDFSRRLATAHSAIHQAICLILKEMHQ